MRRKRKVRDVLSAVLLAAAMILGTQIGSIDTYAAFHDVENAGDAALSAQAETADDFAVYEENGEDAVNEEILGDAESGIAESGAGESLIPPAQSLEKSDLTETEIRTEENEALIEENESSLHEETGEFEGTVVGAGTEELVGASDGSTVEVKLKAVYDQTGARKMLDFVNDFRTGDEAWAYDKNNNVDFDSYAGLEELQYDYDLEQLAMQRAADCVLFYSHVLPDNSTGIIENNRVMTYNGVRAYGENLAASYGYTYTAEQAVTNLKETNYPYSGQGHRRNMLHTAYDRFAAAHVYVLYDTGDSAFGEIRKDFWVQLFGLKSAARNAVVVTEAVNGEQTRTVTICKDYITHQGIELDSEQTLTAGDAANLPSAKQLIKATETYPNEFVGELTTTENGVVVSKETVRIDNNVVAENDLTWTSSNSDVVKIQSGKMYALKAGTASLTAENEICSGTITVKVSAKPTPTPTKKPTLTPTKKPTLTPTKKPTSTPTPTPTKKPTSTPTPTPTKKPTSTPTPTPTKKPTSTPTPTPTKKPTPTPTKKPTSTPTPTPTKKPTNTPTPTSVPAISVSGASISGISKSYGYTGKARIPAFTVKVNGITLTSGTDYTYKFTNNVNPGTAKLTITGKGRYTGTKVRTFEIVDCVSTLVSGKTYQLIPKNNSATAVCSLSGKTVKNTKVYITDRGNSEAMKFRAVKNSDGTWKFINEKCELALAVRQNSSAVGAGLVLYDQTTKAAQNWKMVRKSDNSFAIINAVTGYSIAMSDISAVKGTTLSMAETESSGLQRFYVAETSPVDNRYNGTYYVKSAVNQKYSLNVASSSKNEGANINLYWKNDVNARKFTALYSGGGYYRFVNVNSKLVLTVDGNSAENGANVIQSTWSAKAGQKWKIVKNSDGSVTLKNGLGTMLKLNGTTAKNNVNVVSDSTGSAKQLRWYLE